MAAFSFKSTATAQPKSACSGPTGTAYVAEAGYDGVGALDTANCTVLATYNVDDPANPGDPSDYNYSSTDEVVALDGNKLYFADTGSSTVAVIDSSDLTPSNENPPETLIDVGLFPQGLAVTPDGDQVWTADTGPQTDGAPSSDVDVIDAATNTVTATIPLRGAAQQIAFSPDGSVAYVTTSQGLALIDVASESVITVIGGLGDPRGVAVSPDGDTVYVTDAGSDSVSVISAVTHRVTSNIRVGALPWQVVLSPSGNTAYVADPDSNSISMIDTASDSVRSTISVSGDPDTLALTSGGGELWVGSQASGSLTVINTATGQEVGDIALGAAYEPTSIAIAG
jgi:phospholipase C